MGEEKKEETSKEESGEKKEESKKDEKQEEEAPQEVVLKVDMHCEACARKVKRALKGLEGVEEIMADYKASKVVVKGQQVAADPIKVCQRIQKKCGRKVELISPIPKPKEDKKDQENKQEEPPKEEIKKEPPPVVTIVLKVRMHCDACAQALQKRISKIPGVESVTTDIASDNVIVKGVLDPEKLVIDVYKKTGKKASVVANEDDKKEEGKKDDEKKEEKPQEEGEKKESSEEGKEEGDEDGKKSEVKRSEYWPSKYYMEYYHAPQLFSDENPNACSVM